MPVGIGPARSRHARGLVAAHLEALPDYGSGPLATVVQDLLSIAVYFAIAVPLAT